MNNTQQQLLELSNRMKKNIILSQWNNRKHRRDIKKSLFELEQLCDKALKKIKERDK